RSADGVDHADLHPIFQRTQLLEHLDLLEPCGGHARKPQQRFASVSINADVFSEVIDDAGFLQYGSIRIAVVFQGSLSWKRHGRTGEIKSISLLTERDLDHIEIEQL